MQDGQIKRHIATKHKVNSIVFVTVSDCCGCYGQIKRYIAAKHRVSSIVFVMVSDCCGCYGQIKRYIAAKHRVSSIAFVSVSDCCCCISSFTISITSISISGVPRMQKLRAPLVGTQGYQRFPLSKPVEGLNIALHSVSAYRASIYLVSAFLPHFQLHFTQI